MLIALLCVAFLSTFKALFFLLFPKLTASGIPDQVELQKFASINELGSQPLWTILVPLYNESIDDLQALRKNIFASEYTNFEVIYLCEEVDFMVNYYLKNYATNPNEKILVVPRRPPFTKPKACNYGLEIARGEYIVIYDVEDIPHPLQLRCASYYFRNSNYDCIQFPLEFVHDGSMLSGFQVIDYVLWYKNMLPILQNLNAPIPLGGTSNHFRAKTLRESGGWDSFNVTEDAELGMRMNLQGLTVYYVENYETKERTLPNIINLMNQRVRWSKGHCLTFLQVFPKFLVKSPFKAIFVFLTLASSPVTCIGYITVTLGLNFLDYNSHDQRIIAMFFIWGIILFFLYPAILLIRFPELRKRKIIASVLFYNVYMIFYIIPIIKSLVECVFRPSVWYKTMR